MKRTIVLSRGMHVALRMSQLVLRVDSTEHQVPIEDLGVVIVEHGQTTVTAAAMRELARHGVVVMFCDETHHPISLQLPIVGHSEFTQRARQQLESSVPLKKQLWKQVVVAKLGNQAQLLQSRGHVDASRKLMRWAREVKSGDAENREAIAAQHYWRHLFSSDYRRQREGGAPNPQLNYGYAVLRAAVARAVVASGLLGVVGLHHRNKYNPFCLADDLMEPFRPFVDHAVLELIERGGGASGELTKEEKAALLEVLAADSVHPLDGHTSPLWVAISKSVQSLVLCFANEKRQLFFPQFVDMM